MNAYSIFDDFTDEARDIMLAAGIELTIHPLGVPRPNHDQMRAILEKNDCVIIGTSQKITEDMFEHLDAPRIIATASVGVDHIKIPDTKRNQVTIINTPEANAQSVAEYTIGCALACVKRLSEGNKLYQEGKNNKSLYKKPEDLAGKTIGVIGAGNISMRIMEYAQFFGMEVLCWTRNPEHHSELLAKGVRFVEIEELAMEADIVSVNLPLKAETEGIISSGLVEMMKPNAIFISVSRLEIVDIKALLRKAEINREFYVCLDMDVNDMVVDSMPHIANVQITPHIAGGTIETRKRMFREVAERLAAMRENAINGDYDYSLYRSSK